MPLASLVILLGAAACKEREVVYGGSDSSSVVRDNSDRAVCWAVSSVYIPEPIMAPTLVAAAVQSAPAVQATGAGAGSAPVAQNEVMWWFLTGYRAALGPPEYEEHLVEVIPCESEWQLDPGNPNYCGLGQFDWGTWASYSRFGAETDCFDAWEQGWTVANLIGDLLDRGLSPGSTQGWPTCWWR